MASSSNSLLPPKAVDAEERKGLLSRDDNPYDSGSFEEDDIQVQPRTWSRKRIASVAIALIGLLVTGTFTRTLLFAKYSRPSAPHNSYSGTALSSNGTHGFKRTVLIVSIDGLRYFSVPCALTGPLTQSYRADYLDRKLTPHLLNLSKKGLRAKSMRPVFPVRSSIYFQGSLTYLYPLRL